MPTSADVNKTLTSEGEDNFEIDEQIVSESSSYVSDEENRELDDSIFLESVQTESQLEKELADYRKQLFNELANNNSNKLEQRFIDKLNDLNESAERPLTVTTSFESSTYHSNLSNRNTEVSTLTANNQIYIPADGDCLYTSVFVGYLLPIIHDHAQFKQRLAELTGLSLSGSDILRQHLIYAITHGDTNYFRFAEFKRLINLFRTYMGLDNGLWGGTDEIKILSQHLNIVIQEMYVNPDYPAVGNFYTSSDSTQRADNLNLEQFETIFILRTNPTATEVIQVSVDVNLQTAQMASVLSSHYLQHYRLISTVPINSFKENLISEEFPAVISQQEVLQPQEFGLLAAKQNTHLLAEEIQQIFQALFNPRQAKEVEPQNAQVNHQFTLEKLTGIADAHSFLARATEFVPEASPYPGLKTSEYATLIELLTRTGMQERPAYFSHLPEDKTISSDDMYGIGLNFLKEFVRNGALDAWITELKKTKLSQQNDSTQAASEFIDGIANFFRYAASDAINDPTQDPLSKGISPANIGRLLELDNWLENNEGHPKYVRVIQEREKLNDEICSSRHANIENIASHAFSLFKRMKPEISHKQSMAEVVADQEKESKIKQLQKFKELVLNIYQKFDPFEPNYLRHFWETISRGQYGQICYQMVCESFDANHKNSEIHQLVQNTWALSKLDTIHIQPQEARSRMPNASVDGTAASNFGYGIARSAAYQKWIINPVVRANADIIMDAYHAVIDFGRELDIAKFIKFFGQHLSKDKKVKRSIYKYPHEYDTFMPSFMLFLLEKVFQEVFDKTKGSIKKQLIQAAGTKENLINKAKEALQDFKNFAEAKFTLRPTLDEVKPKKTDGLVFGIGFNGKAFDAPEPSKKGKNEIWLTFSESARQAKGYGLLMEFIKHVSRYSDRLTSIIADTPARLHNSFLKYKAYLLWLINNRLQGHQRDLDTDWMGPKWRRYHKEQLVKYKDFKNQLEQTATLDELSPEFKEWITQTSNWYTIAPNVSIEIPDEMPEQEQQTQNFARNLLFDALAQRPFSQMYPQLLPLLFLHWREKLLNLLTTYNAKDTQAPYQNFSQSPGFFAKQAPINLVNIVQAAKKLEDIPDSYKATIIAKLDELVAQVHPELKSIWESVIREEYQAFKEKSAKLQTLKLDKADKKVNEEKQKFEKGKNNPKAVQNLQYKYRKAQEELEKLRQIQPLPDELSQLSVEQFEQFRQYVFEKRDVAQCIEPLFARVLGHDKFFPVYISKKINRTEVLDKNAQPLQLGNLVPQDVIPPCDARCQLHALGHLYTGDILSYQSADRLDQIRKIHNLGEVPDKWMPLNHPALSPSNFEMPHSRAKSDNNVIDDKHEITELFSKNSL